MRKKISEKLSGMTLIEMIMAIAIFLVGILGFTLLFIRTWGNNSYTIEMGQSSLAVSQGLNKMTDYIRRTRQGDNGAYPVVSANDNDLVIYCDYNKDNVTERVHFYKNNQNIMMGITLPTLTIPKSYPVGDQQTSILMSHVVNSTDNPIFEYFNKNYPLDMTNNPASTPALVWDIRLVKIYLEVNTVPNRGPDSVKMESFVEMRNLNDYNLIQ